MQLREFAAAFARRINQPPDLSEHDADFRVFTAMLRATAPHIPARLRFDEAGLKHAKDSLADSERWAAKITPEQAKRLLTPYEVSLKRHRDALQAVYVLRATWRAFSDLFAAQDACDVYAEQNALVRLVVFAYTFPVIYWRFDLHFQPYGREASAALTAEYQRFDKYFRPPETWIANGGDGQNHTKHIFPPYTLTNPTMAEAILAEYLVIEDR